MIRVFVRRSADISYLATDRALELEGIRDGPALWFPLGERGGRDPRDVLVANARHVLGYDLVVAAPRAISCLAAVGTPDEQRATIAAHRDAVAGAVAYLENRALVVQRSVLGEIDELSGTWPAVASFTHGVNRAGEPHVHDHVLVGAKTQQRTQQLDARSLYNHLAAADALYRSGLRDSLSRATGRDVWRSWRGTEFVGGLDEGVRALWPGRSSDRGEKREWTREDIVQRWRSDQRDYFEGPLLVAPKTPRGELNEHAFAAALEGRNVIRRQDLVESWANAATFGTSAPAVDAAIDQWYPDLAHERGRGAVAISRNRARMQREVHERGPRSLEREPIDQSRPRDRSTPRDLSTPRDRSSERSGRGFER